VAFSPEGATLVSGSDDRTLRLWDVENGVERRVLTGQESAVGSVAFSPDGATVASASYNGTISLRSAATGACLATLLPLHEGWVAFTPDGRYKLGGAIGGAFWHAIGLCRFEPGELPSLRVPDDVPLFTLPRPG
jgi:WD40 repeat protein